MSNIDLEQIYQACTNRTESVEKVLQALKYRLPGAFEQARLTGVNPDLLEVACDCLEDEVAKLAVKSLRADNCTIWIISWKKGHFRHQRIFRFTRRVRRN